jgi:hypothetical protein
MQWLSQHFDNTHYFMYWQVNTSFEIPNLSLNFITLDTQGHVARSNKLKLALNLYKKGG